MSHDLFELDRPVFGSNVPAWHGLGRVRPGQYGSAVEACRDALAWRVDLEPALADAGDGQTFPVDGAFLTTRDDLHKSDRRQHLHRALKV